ncbi:MAG: endonuclease V [Leptolyngbyaceae bacterium]|nr:endonuclease V [Leptolyngbyaceae bacterium]
MILAVDVHYEGDRATVAGILFEPWQTDTIAQALVKRIDAIAPYEPGAFYKRELPCILSLLSDVASPLNYIVIDGFVTLGAEQKPGLGMYLHHHLQQFPLHNQIQPIPVIGVAKNSFMGTSKECKLLRGSSEKPLFVTTAGMDLTVAKTHILSMHGDYRIPTLLKKVDQLCRHI